MLPMTMWKSRQPLRRMALLGFPLLLQAKRMGKKIKAFLKAAGEFLMKWGKLILIVVGGIIAAVLGIEIFKSFKALLVGAIKDEEEVSFRKVFGNPNVVEVKTKEGYVVMPLPIDPETKQQMKSSQVRAAGISKERLLIEKM